MTFAGGSDHGFGTPEHKMFYHTIYHNRAQAKMDYVCSTGYETPEQMYYVHSRGYRTLSRYTLTKPCKTQSH